MIEGLLDNYEELREQLELPPLDRAYVLVERQALTPDYIEEKVAGLEAAEGAQGWLRRQSQVYRSLPSEKTAAPNAGLPLSGEWRLSDTESKHLRQDGKGGWLLYRYRQFDTLAEAENANKECGGKGQVHACLQERTTLLAADGGSNLAYHIYWGGEGANIRRLFARFSGFEAAAQQKGETHL